MSPIWAFDLDNTLYPADSGLFDLVDRRITRFMVERVGVDPGRVPALRARYRDAFGVTLGGLVAEHGVDPDAYLAYVHDVPLEQYLFPDEATDLALAALPGRKVVFTNGSVDHAWRVLDRLGLRRRFDAVFDIAFMDYVPKPRPHGYRKLLDALLISPETCRMVDDLPVNLDTARDLGMGTVLVGPAPADGHPWVERVADLPGLARIAPG